MKKNAPIYTIALACFLLYPSFSRAADITIGPAFWYAWWNPMFEKKAFNLNRYGDINSITVKIQNDFEITPSYLAGLAFSVGFLNKWSFSTVFVCGNHYEAKSSIKMINSQMDRVMAPRDTMTIIQYDLDSTPTCLSPITSSRPQPRSPSAAGSSTLKMK